MALCTLQPADTVRNADDQWKGGESKQKGFFWKLSAQKDLMSVPGRFWSASAIWVLRMMDDGWRIKINGRWRGEGALAPRHLITWIPINT